MARARNKAWAPSLDATRRLAGLLIPDGIAVGETLSACAAAEAAPGRLLPWVPVAFGRSRGNGSAPRIAGGRPRDHALCRLPLSPPRALRRPRKSARDARGLGPCDADGDSRRRDHAVRLRRDVLLWAMASTG